MKRLFFTVLFILSFCTYPSITLCASQNTSLTLGAATLHLGTSKQKVIQQIHKAGLVIESRSPESFMVIPKGEPPFKALGQIIFNKNKLVFISKEWGDVSGKKAFNIMETLHSTLLKITQSEPRRAKIETTSLVEPGYEVKHITIYVDPYEILIIIMNDQKHGQNVSITQYLKDYENLPWVK